MKSFCAQIEQAKNRGEEEKADCRAIKFDGGFAKQNAVVDYIELFEQGLIMIEMKDLQSIMLNNFNGKPTEVELGKVFKNMINKFKNTLASTQQEINDQLISVSNYLVWKNNTDIVLMDRYLPAEFRNRPYQICKTDEICEKLSALNTRLCQE
ncbi:MAG: hypothetical protein PSN36_02030 [Gammaproteobacteria bacterium]|nr:hypothetical protein [Gammaproteobacteria bacterium]